jgi:ribosomal-protein-alanine N-acetyltransferase
MIKENINKITSQDVHLREFQQSDALAYFQLYNNPLVKKYIPSDMIPKDINASIKQIKTLFLQGRDCPYWAIVKNENNSLIGSCGFVNQEIYHKRIELAYDLHPDYWGNGIMHHALVACTKYAFENLKVQRLEAVTLQDNMNSIKSLLKLGMQHEGTLRNFKFFKGKMIDVESFAITFADYNRIYKNII